MPAAPLDPAARGAARLLARPPAGAHAGLLFDRYLPLWEGQCPEIKRVKELQPPLKAFADAFNARRPGDPGPRLLAAHHARLDRVLGESAPRFDFTVNWRLAIGLGADHPIENGFTFDPVIGVPILPGSSVKGLLRAAAELEGWPAKEIGDLFGPDLRAGTAGRGAIRFLDAYPKTWPRLAVDVVNCHHPGYYRELAAPSPRGRGPGPWPRETDSPIPVFFLTVDAGSIFRFRMLPSPGQGAVPEKLIKLLATALDLLGIGAKTAVGYGVMRRD